MATINVKTTDRGDTYEFEVTVKEGLGETHHRVTLRKADPEALVSESFRYNRSFVLLALNFRF